jgi:hypothetical protein
MPKLRSLPFETAIIERRIPSRATAPASVCSRWRASTAIPGSKQVVRGH